MKVKVYVSGWITEADGTKRDVMVCEREDGERIERVFSGSYDFNVEADKLIVKMKRKPKREMPKVKEVEVE